MTFQVQQDEYDIDFNRQFRSQVVASDPSGDPIVTFIPQRATIKTGSYENVTVVAADSSGNRASCHFQIAIQPTPCSEWELVAPIHGSVECQDTDVGGFLGHECVAKCDVGYR